MLPPTLYFWRNFQTKTQQVVIYDAIKGAFLFLCCNISPATFIIDFRNAKQPIFQNTIKVTP